MLFKHHLESEYGFDVRNFNYRSLHYSLDENANALADYINDNDLSDSHLVGHSLGGIVSLRMLANESAKINGRDAAEEILKGFSKRVKDTKITGPSGKFKNQRVGLSHVLKDLDVVEFHTR